MTNQYDITKIENDAEFKKGIKRVDGAVKAIQDLTVKSPDEEKKGIVIGKGLSDVEKELKAKQTDLISGAEHFVKTVKGMFKPKFQALKDLKIELNNKMKIYRDEVEEKAQKERERIERDNAKKMEKFQEKAEQRIAEGKSAPKMPTIVAPSVNVDQTQRTETGEKVTYRTNKIWRIIDEKKVPREYLMLDTVKINAARKANIEIKGIEYDEEKTPVYGG